MVLANPNSECLFANSAHLCKYHFTPSTELATEPYWLVLLSKGSALKQEKLGD